MTEASSAGTEHWLLLHKSTQAESRLWEALTQLIDELAGGWVLGERGVWALSTKKGSLEAAANRSDLALAARVHICTQVTEIYCLPWGESGLLLAQKTLTPSIAWWATHPVLTDVRVLPTSDSKPVRLPVFLEIVQILAANSCGSTATLETELVDSRLETQYLHDLVQEQGQELHNLRERLRAWVIPQASAADAQWDSSEQTWLEEPNLSRLGDWCAAHTGLISLAPRAFAGAKKSIYSTPKHVYQALLFLAGPYREHRLGALPRDAFEEALKRSGCQLRGSVGMSVAGEQGDAYFLKWGDKRRLLDLHLARGGGRDERYCMRVYFFWDDDLKQCVVGWLPSHLSNSLS